MLPVTVAYRYASQQSCHSEHRGLDHKSQVPFLDHRNISHNILKIYECRYVQTMKHVYFVDRADMRINIYELVLKFLISNAGVLRLTKF